jgi:hypothetical protein
MSSAKPLRRTAMTATKKLIVLLSMALVALVGCHELGHIDGLGDYGNLGGNIVGEIQAIDPRASEIEIRSDAGRTSLVRYDRDTRVVYQQRNYAVSNLEPGDYVALHTQADRQGGLYTDVITVRESAQNRLYSGSAGLLRGAVIRNDPRYSSILIEADNRRQYAFYHDATTRVRYRNRDYPVNNIQPGDYLEARTRNPAQQTPTADLITITSTAQERKGTPGSPVSKLAHFEGRVEYIDSQRGTFEMRGQNRRLVVVNLQYNPPRAVSDYFNRMRNGDYVRVEGRFINQDRFELENFI